MARVDHRRLQLTPNAGATSAVDQGPPASHRRRNLRRGSAAVLFVLTVAVGASVAGLLPVQVARVSSASMAPTIGDGDLVLIEHGAGPLARRDVVAARHPDTGERLVKRVVALAGDRVAIQDGVLMVNGSAACEPSIDPEGMDGVWSGTTTVPPGQVFLMGDERDLSIDSRDFGPVAVADVDGLVRTRVWPSPGALPVDSC